MPKLARFNFLSNKQVLPVYLLKASLFCGENKQLLVFIHINNQCPLLTRSGL